MKRACLGSNVWTKWDGEKLRISTETREGALSLDRPGRGAIALTEKRTGHAGSIFAGSARGTSMNTASDASGSTRDKVVC